MKSVRNGLLASGRFLAVSVLVTALSANLSAQPPANVSSVADLAAPLVDDEVLTGVSIVIVQADANDDYQTSTFHFGRTGHGQSAPNDETVYEIGSVTKVFTSILMADYVTSGKATLQTPANDLIDGENPLPSLDDKPITLLDLSTHRSGLPRLGNNMPDIQTDDPYKNYDRKLAEEFFSAATLSAPPGTKYEYSNLAVGFLGNLLMRAQDYASYDEMLQTELTGPLNIPATRVVVDEDAANFAIGHDASGNPVSPWHFADMPGAGGIRSHVRDMGTFLKANLASDKTPIAPAIDLAFEQHRAGSGSDFAMGLGWLIARDGSTRWHNGQTGGYASAVFVNRDLRLAVGVLSNTSSSKVFELAEKLIQWKAGMPVSIPESTKTVHVDPEVMDRYVGKYQLIPTFVFDVKRDGDKLMVGITNQLTIQVFPSSETEWFYKVVDAKLVFGDIRDGKAHTVTLLQNGIEQVAKRIAE
jgi:serine-type D-Ala-D-Ala carboxypeptidase/endopeptidase